MPTYRNDGSLTRLVEDVDGVTRTVRPGETVETYQVLTGADWTQTAATPIWSPILDTHEITAEEAGVVEQAVDPAAGVLEIQTDVAITVHINAADGPGYPLPADKATQIKTLGRISALHINFYAAGNVSVVELRE